MDDRPAGGERGVGGWLGHPSLIVPEAVARVKRIDGLKCRTATGPAARRARRRRPRCPPEVMTNPCRCWCPAIRCRSASGSAKAPVLAVGCMAAETAEALAWAPAPGPAWPSASRRRLRGRLLGHRLGHRLLELEFAHAGRAAADLAVFLAGLAFFGLAFLALAAFPLFLAGLAAFFFAAIDYSPWLCAGPNGRVISRIGAPSVGPLPHGLTSSRDDLASIVRRRRELFSSVVFRPASRSTSPSRSRPLDKLW